MRHLEFTGFTATVDHLVIAGFTGRDAATLEAHFAELAALGVRRPASVPVFYRLAASLLAQDELIEVVGPDSSGEAEAVILALRGDLWLGVGSDHTDRSLEEVSITASKQVCAKPLGRELWPFAEVAGHWDRLRLRSYLARNGTRELYQEGTLGSNLSALDLIKRYTSGAGLTDGTVMYCGTLPVNGGLRSGMRFEVELEDPVLGRSLRHSYGIHALPMAERATGE